MFSTSPVAAQDAPECDGLTATHVIVDEEGWIETGPGDDVVVVRGDDMYLDTQGGNDVVCADGEPRSVRLGDGNDRFFGTSLGGPDNRSNMQVDGGAGTDRIEIFSGTARGGYGSDLMISASDVATVGGGEDDDLVRVLAGGSGDGGPGNDRVIGSKKGDYLSGGSGDDLIVGGPGDDVLRGDDGQDKLVGGPGADDLKGGFGSDVLRGGQGPDTLIEDASDAHERYTDDIVYGGSGNDTIIMKDRGSDVRGGKGHDSIEIMNDTKHRIVARGGPGADTMNALGVNVDLHGEGGPDKVSADFYGDGKPSAMPAVLSGGAGHDLIVHNSMIMPLLVLGGAGDDTILPRSWGSLGITIRGGDGNDVILGTEGDDEISSGNGKDFVDARSGNDTVVNKGDRDSIAGGYGDDYIDSRKGSCQSNAGAFGLVRWTRDNRDVIMFGEPDSGDTVVGCDGVFEVPGLYYFSGTFITEETDLFYREHKYEVPDEYR